LLVVLAIGVIAFTTTAKSTTFQTHLELFW